MTLQTILEGQGAVTQVNENFDAVGPAGTYGRRAPGISGLTWAYYGGRGFGNTIADGTVTLTASATNYIVANRSTGAVSVATTTTNWNDSTGYYRVALIVTGASTITTETDYREFSGGSSGAFTGGTLTSALNEAPQVALPSAATVNIGAAAANTVTVSGTTTITAFDTIATGAIRRVRFLAALTLTHNATSLILPGSANITTSAGDVATMESLGSGNWRCVNYSKADGTALVGGGGGGSGTVTSVDASGGVETASGSPITAAGTIRGAVSPNAQTGTSYTVVTGDRGKLLTFSNASAVAVTLPQATSTFGSGWYVFLKNLGAGTATITPTTSTIGGAASLALTTGQWAMVVSDGTNYNTLFVSSAGGGGSLTNWTEAVNTAAPNATVPVVSLTATNAATNVDAVISPKGTGALSAHVADGTSTGGGKRGPRAVDWQMQRTSSGQVASGNNSVIAGGQNNIASGNFSVIGGGAGNTASASNATVAGGISCQATSTYATVGGGNTNIAGGAYSFIGGGNANTASANFSAVGGGSSNAASGDYSAVLGGFQATTRGLYGTWAWASGVFSSQGDAQEQHAVLRATTTNATTTGLSADAGTPAAATSVVLPNNSMYCFEATVSAKVATFGDRAAFKITGAVSRGANAAATQIDGTVTVTTVAAIGGASAWTVTAVANTTLGSLEIRVTGVAGTTIKWVAEVKTLQLVG